MGEVIGVVGSARPWGNSELLVREALRGALEEGATVQLLRLTALHVEPCTGCMRCVIGGQPCRIDDDMAWLVERLGTADGLALAAPTYFLGIAASVKMVLDRLLMVTGRVQDPLPRLRPAVTIAAAGLEGWQGVALPFLNALALGFGFQPIESLLAVAPGPGEVLLDDTLMQRIFAAGRRLALGELEPAPAPPQTCPVCRSEAFVLHGFRAVCPICGREATIEPGDGGFRLRFEPEVKGLVRWTPEGMRHHMIDWIQATGPRYAAHRDEIKARRAPYRQMDVEWLCPPRHNG